MRYRALMQYEGNGEFDQCYGPEADSQDGAISAGINNPKFIGTKATVIHVERATNGFEPEIVKIVTNDRYAWIKKYIKPLTGKQENEP